MKIFFRFRRIFFLSWHNIQLLKDRPYLSWTFGKKVAGKKVVLLRFFLNCNANGATLVQLSMMLLLLKQKQQLLLLLFYYVPLYAYLAFLPLAAQLEKLIFHPVIQQFSGTLLMTLHRHIWTQERKEEEKSPAPDRNQIYYHMSFCSPGVLPLC